MKKKILSILIVGIFLFTTIFAVSAGARNAKETSVDDVPQKPENVRPDGVLSDQGKFFDPYDDVYSITLTSKVNGNGVYIQFNITDGESEFTDWIGPFNDGEYASYTFERTWGSMRLRARASYNPSGEPASEWTGYTSYAISKGKPVGLNLPNLLRALLERLNLI